MTTRLAGTLSSAKSNRGRDADHRAINEKLSKIPVTPDAERCREPIIQTCSFCGFPHYTPGSRCVGCGEMS